MYIIIYVYIYIYMYVYTCMYACIYTLMRSYILSYCIFEKKPSYRKLPANTGSDCCISSGADDIDTSTPGGRHSAPACRGTRVLEGSEVV